MNVLFKRKYAHSRIRHYATRSPRVDARCGRAGVCHLHYENRCLHVMPSGEPSWLAEKTAGVHGSRRREKEDLLSVVNAHTHYRPGPTSSSS